MRADPMALPSRNALRYLAIVLLALTGMFRAGASQAGTCSATTLYFAAASVVGAGDGSSWTNAITLHGALSAVNSSLPDLTHCYEIRLRQGVYKPDANTNNRD